jgi:hypothetical protein
MKAFMNWVSFVIRGVLLVVMVCGLLFMAEQTFPFAAVLIFLLLVSILTTWIIINLLRNSDILADFFE